MKKYLSYLVVGLVVVSIISTALLNYFIWKHPTNSFGLVSNQSANMGYNVSTTYFDVSTSTPTLVAPARYGARYYWLLQNISTSTQWVNLGSTSTAIASQTVELLPDGSFSSDQTNNYPGQISVASSSAAGRMIFVESYR